MNKPRKYKRTQQSRCGLIGGSLSVSNANALIADWRKRAKGCMRMSRHHEKDGRTAELESRAAEDSGKRKLAARKQIEARDHESNRYRWRRVAETFRCCAKELRRQAALSNNRQPKSNKE
jgi:hypothetical protein